eukprot:1567293-Prymnesium_polylepis.1
MLIPSLILSETRQTTAHAAGTRFSKEMPSEVAIRELQVLGWKTDRCRMLSTMTRVAPGCS